MEANQWLRDAAETRQFLAVKQDYLHSREVAYQMYQGQPIYEAIGCLHADCLLLMRFDIECEPLRAAYAAATILTAADDAEDAQDAERRRRGRRALVETRAQWQDFCQTLRRVCYRIEIAFTHIADSFGRGAEASGRPGQVSKTAARLTMELWLLGDLVASLLARVGLPRTLLFDACRDRLRLLLDGQNELLASAAETAGSNATRTGAPRPGPGSRPGSPSAAARQWAWAAYKLSRDVLLAVIGAVCGFLAFWLGFIILLKIIH